jgi:GH25 family lysozyme M1 (1,4-beta-N-acetylmuramidase)
MAYDCDNGASVDAVNQAEADQRCKAFIQYKKRGEIKVDPAIEDRIPKKPPGNREIRSFALVVVVHQYNFFPEPDDKELMAVKNDIPKIVNFLREQNFDEIILLENEKASVENINYFLNTYFLNQVKIYDQRSRFLFAFDGHGALGENDNSTGSMALTQAQGERDRVVGHVYPLKYLQADLEAIAAHAFHTIALLGSCYSGGVFPIDPSHGQSSVTFPKKPGAHAITAADPIHRAWTDPNSGGTVFFEKFLDAVKQVGEDKGSNESSEISDETGKNQTLYDSIVRLGVAFDRANILLEEVQNPATHELYPQLTIGSIAPEEHYAGAFFFLGPRPAATLPAQASESPATTGSAVVGHPEIKVFRALDTYSIRGVDLSHYNDANLNFEALKDNQIRFVYLKATQGAGYYDNHFKHYLENARKANLAVGAYHFFSWCVPAEQQFQIIKSKVPLDDNLLPIGIDVEWMMGRNGPNNTCSDFNFIKSNLHELLKLTQDYFGKVPVIATAKAFTDQYPIIDDSFNNYPLWVMDLNRNHGAVGKPSLPGNNPWSLWLFTDKAKFTNVEGSFDLNVFFGSEDDFQIFAAGKGNPALRAALR